MASGPATPYKRNGFTLIELIVATLMIGVIAGAMMSLTLTGRMSVGRVDRRVSAAAAVRGVSEALKAYVTADRALAQGPGAGPDGWTLPGDLSVLPAFGAGHHELSTAQWAPALAAQGGRISYDVAVRQTPSGPEPDVSFSVSWND